MNRFLGRLNSMLAYPVAASIARRFLSIAGFGVGTSVNNSGEIGALRKAMDLAGINPSQALTVFDVGGHVGEWTSSMLALCPEAKVHAFEPSEQHRFLFRQALGGNARVTLVETALGASEGEATLFRDKSVSGLASLTKRKLDHKNIEMNIEERVTIRTLDAYCSQNRISHIDILKIDVEGHELDVLSGAGRMLGAKAISIVQFEFGGSNIDTRTYMRDFFDLFDAAGYDLYLIRSGGRLARIGQYREFLEQFVTTNYLAVLRTGSAGASSK